MEAHVVSQKPPVSQPPEEEVTAFKTEMEGTLILIKTEAWSSPRSWRLENTTKDIISSNEQKDANLQLSG